MPSHLLPFPLMRRRPRSATEALAVALDEPDWDELTACNDEVERLVRRGELTRATWLPLLRLAERAVGRHTWTLEGFLMRGVELGMLKR